MKCPVCGNTAAKSHSYRPGSPVFFDKNIFACLSCYMHFGDIQQNDLNHYYVTQYDQDNNNRSSLFSPPGVYFSNERYQFKPARSKLHARLLKKFLCPSLAKKPRILDLGAGLGTTLYWAKNEMPNAEIVAYENSRLCEPYLKHLGANLLHGDPLGVLNECNDVFDAVVMSHFLEHLSPHVLDEFMNLLSIKMRSGSVLLIEVPHDDWFQFPSRKHNKEPHVSFFSSIGLKNLLKGYYDIKVAHAYGIYSSDEELSLGSKILTKFRKLWGGIPFFNQGGSLLLVAVKF